MEALRVRKFLPKNIEIKCERCGNNITASGNMSAEQVAEYAKKSLERICALPAVRRLRPKTAVRKRRRKMLKLTSKNLLQSRSKSRPIGLPALSNP